MKKGNAYLIMLWVGVAVFLGGFPACTSENAADPLSTQDLRMTFLHTTDTHSHILPYKYIPSVLDRNQGILPCPGDDQFDQCSKQLDYALQDLLYGKKKASEDPIPDPGKISQCMDFITQENEFLAKESREPICVACIKGDAGTLDDPEACYNCLRNDIHSSVRCENFTYGGAARAAWVIARERKRAIRSAHVDSGDFFQGAPIYNLFQGIPEVKALSAMGCDISTIGNHEFDSGVSNLSKVLYANAKFPLVNANYMWEDITEPGSSKIGNLVSPVFIKDYDGLTIGYVGMGNIHSMTSIGNASNSLGIRAIDTFQAVSTYVSLIRNQVDLVVLVSHLGVHSDIDVAKNVSGIDIIFGGHDHVITYPPLEIVNPDGKKTLVVHSGVNYKAVGRLDVVVRGRKILMHDYTVLPINSSETAYEGSPTGQDGMVAQILYDYEFELNRAQDLKRVIGVANDNFPRYAQGDSPLGNLVANAMRARRRVETDFSMTNTLGIRADLNPGSITVGKLYEIFPFENTVTTMYMSGTELKVLFDFVAERTANYGCSAQIQLSGARTVINCTRKKVRDLEINGISVVKDYKLVSPFSVFSMATNDYIAGGGSGFWMLEQNPTKTNTMLSLRDVVMDYIEEHGELNAFTDGRIKLIKENGGNDSTEDPNNDDPLD